MVHGPEGRMREMVAVGGDLAPLEPTAYLKLDPWGHLWQWHEATTESPGCSFTAGKWLRVPRDGE
jgi:hypothetical protein